MGGNTANFEYQYRLQDLLVYEVKPQRAPMNGLSSNTASVVRCVSSVRSLCVDMSTRRRETCCTSTPRIQAALCDPVIASRATAATASMVPETLFVAVDDHARIAFTGMPSEEKTPQAVQFLRDTAAHYAKLGGNVMRLLTDNVSA